MAPSNAMAQPFSLFQTLTSSSLNPIPSYPVAELIERLVLVVGHEICLPQYRRNILSSYQVVSSARDILDHIRRITITDDSSEIDAWAGFQKYISLIEPTETLLLDLLPKAEAESSRLELSELDVGFGADGYLAWVNQWETTRQAVAEALTALAHITPAEVSTKLDSKTLREQDDRSYIQTLRFDELDKFRRTRRVGTLPTEIITSFKGIEIKYDNEVAVVWYTKVAMMLNATFKVATMDVARVPPEFFVWKFHDSLVKVQDIWTLVKELVDAVNQLAAAPSGSDTSQVQSKWDAFIAVLRAISPVAGIRYTEILKLVPEIRRPFYGQAIALITLFKVLVEHFNLDENRRNPEMLGSLQDAMERLKTSLTNANTTLQHAVLTVDLADSVKTAVQNELSQAETALEECWTSFKPESEDVTAWKARIIQAKEGIIQAKAADELRLQEFKNKIESKTFAEDTARDSMDIKVVIHKSATDPAPESTTYNVKKDMLMSALLWKVAQGNPQAIAKATFKSAQQPVKVIGMDEQVGAVGAQVTLELF